MTFSMSVLGVDKRRPGVVEQRGAVEDEGFAKARGAGGGGAGRPGVIAGRGGGIGLRGGRDGGG